MVFDAALRRPRGSTGSTNLLQNDTFYIVVHKSKVLLYILRIFIYLGDSQKVLALWRPSLKATTQPRKAETKISELRRSCTIKDYHVDYSSICIYQQILMIL